MCVSFLKHDKISDSVLKKIRKMSNFGSPLKLGASCSKRPKPCFNFEKCIICQINCDEEVSVFTHNSKSSFLSSVEKRQDEIYNKFIDEYESLDLIVAGDTHMVYHRSCYKSYTSKHNIAVHISRKCSTTGSNQDSTTSSVLTRRQSGPIDWNVCIFCNHKTYKKVKTLTKIESDERISPILDASNHYSDSNIKKGRNTTTNQCITKYLIGIKPENDDGSDDPNSYVNSDYEAAFTKLVNDINNNLMINKKAFLMSSLLEKFFSYLPENVPKHFTTRKLQRKLRKTLWQLDCHYVTAWAR